MSCMYLGAEKLSEILNIYMPGVEIEERSYRAFDDKEGISGYYGDFSVDMVTVGTSEYFVTVYGIGFEILRHERFAIENGKVKREADTLEELHEVESELPFSEVELVRLANENNILRFEVALLKSELDCIRSLLSELPKLLADFHKGWSAK